MLRKQELMYELFGKADGLCKDCEHYLSYRYHDYNRRKCEVYGNTRSGASDMAGNKQACGLFPNKPYNGREIIRLGHGGREKQDVPIEGQMDLFEVFG